MFFFYAFVNFLWGLIATPVSMSLSRTFRLLDVPGGRKQHQIVTPRGAGLVLWTGYLLGSLLNANPGVAIPYIATGATAVFLVGYLDDMHPLSAVKRLFFHLVAAAWVVYPIPVPLCQRILLLLWITGMTNAYNLIDGMDGLSLTMAFLTALVAWWGGNPATWLPLLGLILGVLIWNFPNARTFLGDGGSTLLGFLCASHLAWDLFPRFFGMRFPVLLLVLFLVGGVPVMDTLIAMTRRVLNKRSPFSPDRGHAHHKLLDLKFSKGQVLLLLALFHLVLLGSGFMLAGVYLFS